LDKVVISDYKLFKFIFIIFSSCKQLNDWNSLEIYAGSEEVADPMLLADAFWHFDEWKVLRYFYVFIVIKISKN
jgi:hypothetical protein